MSESKPRRFPPGRQTQPRPRLVVRRTNPALILLPVLLAVGLVVVLLVVVLNKPAPRDEGASKEGSRAATAQTESKAESIKPEPKPEPTPEPTREPRPEPSPESAPQPKPKAQPKPEEPPKKDAAFAMIPCTNCQGTGTLKGQDAVEIMAKVVADQESGKMESAAQQLGGRSWTEEERKKEYEVQYKMAKAQLGLHAAQARWKNEQFAVKCPFCNGTKWRSTAESGK